MKKKDRKLNNCLSKIVILVAMFVMTISINSVKATNEVTTDTTVIYQKWEKLSDEEKSKVIEPLPFSTTYDNRSNLYQKSRLRMFGNLKASYQSKYSLSNLEVKDQKTTNSCWAMSLISAMESNISKSTNTKAPSLSTRHMEYSTSKTFLNGTINPYGYNREVGTGGNSYIGLGYCTSGQGPILESEMPFEDNENKISLSEIQGKSIVNRVKGYTSFPNIYKEYTTDGITYNNGYDEGSSYRVDYSQTDIQNMRNAIKEHIVQYGAITSLTYLGGEQDIQKYFNLNKIQSGTTTYYAYNCADSSVISDHAITIVGWDDNFSADNFNDANKPKSNGAYIVLNSHGDSMYNQGYMYISYEDAMIEQSLFGIKDISNIDYDNIYQHDPLGFSLGYTPKSTSDTTFTSVYGGNIFTRDTTNNKDEKLTSISFYIPETTNIQVYVNANSGDLTGVTLAKNMGTLEPGYYTCELDTPIKLTGDKFAIALKYSADVAKISLEANYLSNGLSSNQWDTATSSAGESFISTDATNWTDLTAIGIKDSNICLKAFTNYEEKQTEINVLDVQLNMNSNTMKVGDEFTLIATVTPDNATNKNVKWESSDTSIATVDSNGKVTAKAEGTATITVSTEDGNKQANCVITVEAKEVYVKVLKITLDSSAKTIYTGENFKLIATITPDNATNKNVKWESSDTSIATVDSNGNVKGVAKGITTITAKSENDGISESCVVTVLNKEEDKNTTDKTDTEIKEPDKNNSGETDDTVAGGIIPQAGASYFIIAAVALIATIAIICFIQLRKNKDIM